MCTEINSHSQLWPIIFSNYVTCGGHMTEPVMSLKKLKSPTLQQTGLKKLIKQSLYRTIHSTFPDKNAPPTLPVNPTRQIPYTHAFTRNILDTGCLRYPKEQNIP